MRFVWPAQRYDRLTREAAVVAAAVTTCAGLAMGLPATRIYRSSDNASDPATGERVETVTFMQARPVPLSPRRRTTDARFTTRAPRTPALSRSDTSSLNLDRVGLVPRVESVTTPLSNDSKAAPRALGPYSASVAVTLGRIDSGAAPPPPWRWVPPTQEQRDSAGRAEAQRSSAARDDHRSVPIALVSIPLRMPFGGASRSPEQRARDAVINEDYLLRLARLMERARAKRESTLATRTIARRDSSPSGKPNP